MDDETLADMEVRLSVLEILIAFQFASEHMQTSDPAGAIHRLRALLLGRIDEHAGVKSEQRKTAILAAMDRAVLRITDLQEKLPRRLVD